MQPNQIVGMGGRNIVEVLKGEARRRPEIAAIMTQIDLGIMTTSDIECVVVPLPWYRQALIEYRKTVDQQRAAQTAQQHVADMGEITVTPPQTGSMLRYTGEDRNLVSSQGISRLTTPIRHGEMMFRQHSGEVWLGSIPLGSLTPVPFTMVREHLTRREYIAEVQPVMTGDVEMARPASMQTASGFSFQRT